MKFEHVRIRNFKSHADTELSLREGVTVIHGVNGSGKSSLLQACFFALYGASAIDGTLDDAIANDAEEMRVTLAFTHAGSEYRVDREVKQRGETAQTTTCVLETPSGPIEQVTDVEAHIEKLLRMDAEAFVNCAYVQQGEVNKLINASPSERQDMIDDLLQLGTLETYRERASDARVGVKRVRDRKRELLADRKQTIEQKEDNDPHGRLNALETELSELTDEIETKERGCEAAEKALTEAEETLSEYETRRKEIDELEADIRELTETISETERERESIEDRIGSLRETIETRQSELDTALAETDLDEATKDAVSDRLETVETEIDEIRDRIEERRLEAKDHANDAENARDRVTELREQIQEKRKKTTQLESEVEAKRDELDERQKRLEELRDRIETLRTNLEDAPVEREELDQHYQSVRERLSEKRERLAELRTEHKHARQAVQEAEQLLEEGKCPECGQPTDGSPHVEGIEDERERVAEIELEIESVESEIERAKSLREYASELDRLSQNRDKVQSLIEQRRETVTETIDRIESLRAEAEDAEERAAEYEKRTKEAEKSATEAREAIGQLNGEKAGLDDTCERLERIDGLLNEIADIERDVETLRERRANKGELNDQRREQLGDKRERRDELEAEFDESAIEEAKENKRKAKAYLSEFEPFLEEKRKERDELQNRIGAVKNELDELESLKEQRDKLEGTVERLESLYDEAAQLQETYGELRSELRRRNVDRLETMLNETFELVYQNDSYARIELDGEYELTVYQKDGSPLDPEQLSGGERAIFNLSLRCAIYRLLSEGIEGQAPTPPLILDEPTVFLDSGHVSKLVELIESMTPHGVAQIIVVSHDDELVGAADDLIAVRKDPTTNRSSVERSVAAETLP